MGSDRESSLFTHIRHANVQTATNKQTAHFIKKQKVMRIFGITFVRYEKCVKVNL